MLVVRYLDCKPTLCPDGQERKATEKRKLQVLVCSPHGVIGCERGSILSLAASVFASSGSSDRNWLGYSNDDRSGQHLLPFPRAMSHD